MQSFPSILPILSRHFLHGVRGFPATSNSFLIAGIEFLSAVAVILAPRLLWASEACEIRVGALWVLRGVLSLLVCAIFELEESLGHC